MATPVTARTAGFKEMERVLRALPERVAERDLASAARAGAQVFRKAIIARAPQSFADEETRRSRTSTGKDYGPLVKNIRVVRLKRPKFSVEFAIHTGAAYWALWYELGNRRQPARPFMTPAFGASTASAINKTAKTLERRLHKTARELAGPLRKISKSTRARL